MIFLIPKGVLKAKKKLSRFLLPVSFRLKIMPQSRRRNVDKGKLHNKFRTLIFSDNGKSKVVFGS